MMPLGTYLSLTKHSLTFARVEMDNCMDGSLAKADCDKTLPETSNPDPAL